MAQLFNVALIAFLAFQLAGHEVGWNRRLDLWLGWGYGALAVVLLGEQAILRLPRIIAALS